MGAFFENLPAPNFPFALPPLAGYNVTVSNRTQSEMGESAPLSAVRKSLGLAANDYRTFWLLCLPRGSNLTGRKTRFPVGSGASRTPQIIQRTGEWAAAAAGSRLWAWSARYLPLCLFSRSSMSCDGVSMSVQKVKTFN